MTSSAVDRPSKALLLAVAATLLMTGVAAAAPDANTRKKSDDVVGFRDSDEKMNAAIAEARRTLPIFWKLLAKDPVVVETGMIKVGFETSGGDEHIWVREVKREGGAIRGVLANRPVYLKASKGDVVTVDPALISDWSYVRDGRMYGGYTLRVMLPSMSPEDRRAYRSFLSDKPLEDGSI